MVEAPDEMLSARNLQAMLPEYLPQCAREHAFAGPLETTEDESDFGHLARPGARLRAKARPILHQPATVLEQIAPAVRRLDGVRDGVAQGHLDHMVGVGRCLCRPI